MSQFYEVGDTLKCLRYVRRYDGASEIRERDLVKVLQAYRFTTPDGGELQDITVQRANDHPIAVIHRLGDFERVEAKHPSEKP